MCNGGKDKGYIRDIKEIEKLNKKENIEKIALIQNQIKDIEELPNIIKPFKILKSLDLRNNPVTKEKVENVFKTIKNWMDLQNSKFNMVRKNE